MPLPIETRNVCIAYEETQVLSDVSQLVLPGETVCLMGPSGSGKSTLLKVLAGLERPDKGTVRYGTHDIYDCPEKTYAQLQRATGFVFQDAALIQNMDVYENLALPLRYHLRLSEEGIAERVEKALAAFDLADKARLRPAKLSTGRQKLVSFARALMLEPEIVFFDDPLANVDHISADVATSIMRERQATGRMTSVVATGDIDFAATIADRIFILYRGEVIAAGTVREITESEDPFVLRIINAIKIKDSEIADEISKFLI